MRNERDEGLKSLGDIFNIKREDKKPPAYKWQELALKIINELNVPAFKKSSIFKVCRDNAEEFVLRCFNDTKELCKTKDSWRYFLKVISEEKSRKIQKEQ